MTELKRLRKELARVKAYLNALPRLIDCSKVYGDSHYAESDLEHARNEVKRLEYLIHAEREIRSLL